MTNSDLDTFFSEEISEIDVEIEDCIKEISKLLKEVKRNSDEVKPSISIDAEEIHNFFIYLIGLLAENDDLEKFLISHLGEFREQNGICLLREPCTRNGKSLQLQEDNEFTSSLWKVIVHRVEMYSFQQLKSSRENTSPAEIFVNYLHIKNHVSLMKSVYVPTLIWTMHQQWRLRTMKHFSAFCNSDSCFLCFLKFCFYSIAEDHVLVYMTNFYPEVITCSMIFTTYFEYICEKLSGVITELKLWSETRGKIPNIISNILQCFLNLDYCDTCCSCSLSRKLADDIKPVFDEYTSRHTSILDIQMQRNTEFDTLYSATVIAVVEALFKLEYQATVLRSGETPVPDHLHFHNFDMSTLTKAVKFSLQSESPEVSPTHYQIHKNPEGNLESFSKKWKLLLDNQGILTELQKMLQKNIAENIAINIEKEKQLVVNQDFHSLLSDNRYIDSTSCLQMKSVLPSVTKTIEQVEMFMPLVYSSDGPFFPFKASFCHSLNSHVVDLIKHIEDVSRGPRKRFHMHYLYISTRSALFLEEKLNLYNKLLTYGGVARSGYLTGICSKAQSLVISLTEEIYSRNMLYIANGILFDACSYDFDDTKPFFEDERVSYSVQMWNVYMRGLVSDLQFYLPQEVGQKLYTKILSESLLQLCHRYARSQPTEARTPQVRRDILTILLCTSQLIDPSCNRASHYIHREISDDSVTALVNKIHSVCCTLLTVLAVVTSPISDIYKVFKNGFPEVPLSVWTKYSSYAPWLPWIRNDLFHQLGKEPLLSSVAVWLAVRTCTTWKQPSPQAVIQAYTEQHCTLSILLMSQATDIPSMIFTESSDADHQFHDKIMLATCIFRLVSCYRSHSDEITGILLPVIERGDGWEEFNNSNIDKTWNQRPWWYQGFVAILDPLLKRIFADFLPLLIQCHKRFSSVMIRDVWEELRSKLDEFITCSCDDNFEYGSTAPERSGKASVTVACIYNLLEGIDDNLVLIPENIRWSLMSLDEHFKNFVSEAEPIYDSLPLQVLLSCVVSLLKEPEKLNDLMGYQLNAEEIGLCDYIAQTLKYICLKQSFSSEITSFHLRRIEKRFEHIIGYFEKSSDFENVLLQKPFKDDLEKELIEMTAQQLLQQPQGVETILYLQKILCINEVCIRRSLGVCEMLSSHPVISLISPSPLCNESEQCMTDSKLTLIKATSPTHLSVSSVQGSSPRLNKKDDSRLEMVSLTPKKALNFVKESQKNVLHQVLQLDAEAFPLQYDLDFDPLAHFDCLGESKFNEAAGKMSDIPWEALLTHLPILGLRETGFCNLFSQRWDVREEGPVPPDVVELISELKNKYDIS